MQFMDSFAQKWNALRTKLSPVMQKIGRFFRKVLDILAMIWRYIVRFKRIIIAIPVAVGAVYLALWNMDRLPSKVGFGIQLDGTFDYMVAREIAVLGPIAVTALCLLLMFCSKRTLTPWLVSVFSLVLPILIWVINAFPS
jgi:hypothetical protein